MRAKRILFLAILLILSLVAIGCQEGDKATAEYSNEEMDRQVDHEPEYGGQLLLALTTIDTLNPLASENESYHHFNRLIFESLFQLDKDFNVVNLLAEDYSMGEDGRIHIKLKDKIYWHDGMKFTARDVAFTIDRIKSKKDSIYKRMWQDGLGAFAPSNINNIIDAHVIDELNIEIIFDKTYSKSLELLTFPIIPEHQFEENSIAEEDYIPIGTGPYKFKDYNNKHIKLEYNDEYRNGRPYIDEVIGKIFQRKDLILTGFEIGDVDITSSFNKEWEKYEQGNVRVSEFVSGDYEFLAFNFSNHIFKGEEGKKLRKAIAYGIDRQAIIGEVFSGRATQSDLPLHPEHWLLFDEANAYGYNMAKARDLLEDLGWQDIKGDGYYEDANGRELSLRLTTNSYNPSRLKVTEMIAEDLDKLGIRINRDYPDTIPENLTDDMVELQWKELNNRMSKGDFDIVLTGWHLSPAQELSFAFHSSQIRAGSNFIRYNNPNMDQSLLQAFSQADKEGKLIAYENLQKIIIDDLPYLSLYFRNNALLMNKRIKGDIEPYFHNLYGNIENCYIDYID